MHLLGRRRVGRWAVALAGMLVVASWLGVAPPGPETAAAAEYKLSTTAVYDVRPDDGTVKVTIRVNFRNTTPNPPGRFSIFEVVDLAVHHGARELRATDARGRLQASLNRRDGVTVASIQPRGGVRYRESARFTISYVLPDGANPDIRVRPSVVLFPVWSFGTLGRVQVELPGAYEVLVDGDALDAERDGARLRLTSGTVEDPTRWLALLTASLPTSYKTLSGSAALAAGPVELEVRAWSDDRRFGRRTLELLTDAMPMLEEELGLDYRADGPLVVVESLPAAGGDLSEPPIDGTDIAVGFDEAPFTIVHQLAHAWLSPALAEDRWIREGFASSAAAAVARGLDLPRPFSPLDKARDLEAHAFPLISWGAGQASAVQDRFAYSASWAVAEQLTRRIGADAVRRAWRRIAGGLDGYRPLDAEPVVAGGLPAVPVSSRHLLDQLEAVSGENLAGIFEEWVFDEATVDLLPARRAARTAHARLLNRAGELGTPDPVRLALAGWRFADAEAAIAEAMEWLADRDRLLEQIAAAGLTAPARLDDEYETAGGSHAAWEELEAEGAVVTTYAVARASLEHAPGALEQVGLLGDAQPSTLLDEARVAFAEGDLVGASEAASRAQDRIQRAGQDGLVRVASTAAIVLLLLLYTISRIRRRRLA